MTWGVFGQPVESRPGHPAHCWVKWECGCWIEVFRKDARLPKYCMYHGSEIASTGDGAYKSG